MASPLLQEPGRFAGKTLGKYEVLSRLSTGGMSEIYLAFQRGLAGFQKLVVLKSILPDIRRDEEFVRMFVDEARMTAGFNHPNIAQVYELDVDNGELFLAMEFVPGATLVEVARACRNNQQAIPIGLTLSAVRDSALALHYAHTFVDPLGRKQSVIHRDVAEKNIMITYDGTTKLLDFGIAKSAARLGRTQIGMVKGTSGYMSPEQIMGDPLDHRTDIFSLGVVLHECLTGMRLFYGPNPEDGMMAALKADVAPPSRTNRQVLPALDAVCLKALSRRREDRHSTALEFARELERVAPQYFWRPEQTSELIQSLFSERREQTRHLYEQARVQGDSTGQINLTHLLQKNGIDMLGRAVQFQSPRTTASGRTPPKETTDPDVNLPVAPREEEQYTLPVKEIPEDLREPPKSVENVTPLSQTQSALSNTLEESEDTTHGQITQFYRRIPAPARYALFALWLSVLWYLFFGFSSEPPKGGAVEVRKPVPQRMEPPPELIFSKEEPLAEPAPEKPQTRVEKKVERKAEPKKPAETATRESRKPGRLTLLTEGGYADVFLGNRNLGITPLYKVSVPAGKHTLRLVKPNRQVVNVSVDIEEGNLTSRRVSLRK